MRRHRSPIHESLLYNYGVLLLPFLQGQTAFDVADEDILGYLEELQKKQNLVGLVHIYIYIYTYMYVCCILIYI